MRKGVWFAVGLALLALVAGASVARAQEGKADSAAQRPPGVLTEAERQSKPARAEPSA